MSTFAPVLMISGVLLIAVGIPPGSDHLGSDQGQAGASGLTPPTPNPLAVFAPLVGRDWVARFSDNNVTDTQRYEWVLDGKFVRNVHHVRAGGQVVYEGETIYAWDQRAGRIVWWYWNSTGGFVTGTLTVNTDGEIVTEGENHGPANQLDRTRTVMRIRENEWTSVGSQEKDGKWTEQPGRIYKPAAPR